MILLALILASAVFADELSTSLSAIREDVHLMGCANDVACWKRTTLRLDDALTTAIGGLDTYDAKLRQVNQALTDAKPILSEDEKPPFYKEPGLWFAIGFAVGAASLIGGAVAFHAAAH